jgi:hypothetical protein
MLRRLLLLLLLQLLLPLLLLLFLQLLLLVFLEIICIQNIIRPRLFHQLLRRCCCLLSC